MEPTWCILAHQGLPNGIPKKCINRHLGLKDFNLTNKTNKQRSFVDRLLKIAIYALLRCIVHISIVDEGK
jgi:hypothetical protein